MSLSHTACIRIVLGVVIALAALLLIRLHNASGATAGAADGAPDFVVVAIQSLKRN